MLLLLDQIARNINRGADAKWVFTECDSTALHVAHHCLRQHFDREFPPHKKLWFYLVLSHSESMIDQELAVAKTASLLYGIRTTKYIQWHPIFKDMMDYAIKYYLTIDKFGQFPHRNEILDRGSTPEETEFLEQKRPWNF
jgi:uncharacterized protein (DUF924 family)